MTYARSAGAAFLALATPGHGLIGATKAQAAELGADEYGFLLWNMGVAGFQPTI